MSVSHPTGATNDPQMAIETLGIRLPGALNSLAETIEDSRSLLDLQDDWDGEGTPGFSEETWRRTVDFVIRGATALWTNHGIVSDGIRILPDRDGGLAIDWRTDRRELLLAVPAQPSAEARFYGDDGASGRTFKGTLDLSEPNRWLVAWLAE